MDSTKNRYRLLVFLNLLAIPITLYLTYMHYKPALSEVCSFNAQWDCEVVNQSIYSTMFGIPVSIFGLGAYVLLSVFAIRGLFHEQRRLVPLVLGCVIGAVGFSLYLTYIEAFILHTFCLFCVAQQVIILLDLATVSSLYLHHRKLR